MCSYCYNFYYYYFVIVIIIIIIIIVVVVIIIIIESLLTNEHLTYVRTALRHYINFLQKKKFEKIVKIRQDQLNLPIYQFKEHILAAINRHQIVLIAGDTGCGKSTQVR